jgi:hypothetical protein
LIEFKSTGTEKHLRKIQEIKKMPAFVRIRVQTKATHGKKYDPKRKIWFDASRSAGQNAIALRANAKKGRNVSFLSSAEEKSLAKKWTNIVNKTMKLGRWFNAESRAVAEKLGKEIIAHFVKHIEQSKVARGRMKPVKKGTYWRKVRETQKNPPPPPMIRTNQLKDAFVVKIEERN